MRQILIGLLVLVALNVSAQNDTTLAPPYKRFPTLPPLQLLMGDSTHFYKKENLEQKPTLIMLFSPECSHCKHTAEEMRDLKEELKNIQIVMATMHPLWQMNEFMQHYGLNEWKNLTAGKDIYYILSGFYSIKSLPLMAMYDKKGKLLYAIEGSLPMKKVLEILKEN